MWKIGTGALFAIALIAVSDVAQADETPSRDKAKWALIFSETCQDIDGFTECLSAPQPVDVRWRRFRCKPVEPMQSERKRAACRIQGSMVIRVPGPRGRKHAEAFPGECAFFWVHRDDGEDAWRTFGFSSDEQCGR